MRSDPLNKIAAKQMIKISFKKRYNKQKKIYKQIENQEKVIEAKKFYKRNKNQTEVMKANKKKLKSKIT